MSWWEKLEEELSKVSNGFSTHTARRALIAVIISPILFLWIVFMIIVGDRDVNADLFNKWLHPNSMELSVANGLVKNDFSIQWKTDLMPGTIELYKNGEMVYGDFFEQEDNYFTVLQQGQPIAVFDQKKKKAMYGHHYHFSLTKLADSIEVKLSIEGRDTSFIRLQ